MTVPPSDLVLRAKRNVGMATIRLGMEDIQLAESWSQIDLRISGRSRLPLGSGPAIR